MLSTATWSLCRVDGFVGFMTMAMQRLRSLKACDADRSDTPYTQGGGARQTYLLQVIRAAYKAIHTLQSVEAHSVQDVVSNTDAPFSSELREERTAYQVRKCPRMRVSAAQVRKDG